MITVKKPTQILKDEHQDVLRKLGELETIFRRLDKKEEVAAPLKEHAAFFETDFWVHFSKEEDALFPELEKFIPRDMGPIGVMLVEHEELRKTNAELQRLIPGYLGGKTDAETKNQIKKLGTRFISVLRDHIHKENDILFMMADMHLDEKQQETVGRLFDKIVAEHKKAAGDTCC
ncbi:MAG: hemerythrin domain-containing protein [Chloroflexi bacterium]|nr:hemerythrin domain-containing protein [Chloroflexota bacterium]